jgi:hypothetical protein
MPLQVCPLSKPVCSLKSTCKKDFGLHLSKTTSFRVIQIAQQSDAAAVNNNELYFLVPNFVHLKNRSFIFVGGGNAKII